VQGRFSLPEDKQTVYADCVRAMMTDIRLASEHASHRLRAPVDLGIKAVETALQATEDARRSG
jgi:hypothetical protein